MPISCYILFFLLFVCLFSAVYCYSRMFISIRWWRNISHILVDYYSDTLFEKWMDILASFFPRVSADKNLMLPTVD